MIKKQLNKSGNSRGMHNFHEGNKGHKHPGINSKPKIELICKYCGIKFYVPPYLKGRIFCTKEHKHKWQSENSCGDNNPNSKPKIELICKYCNNTFYVIKSREDKAKFCSKKCYSNWQEENTHGKLHPCYGIPLADEHKNKLSKSHVGINTGEDHPNWRGGISFGKYCSLFNSEFKEIIRDLYNRRCFICGKIEIENKVKLSVHHVNYNKNCLCGSPCEFVPLCQKCHGITNFNRKYWEDTIMCYLYPERYFIIDI